MRKVRRKSGLNTFDKELIRIVGQHLHSIGLKTSAEVLMAEAGTQLIHPNASNFKKLVLNGEWSQAVRSTYSFYNFVCIGQKISEATQITLFSFSPKEKEGYCILIQTEKKLGLN